MTALWSGLGYYARARNLRRAAAAIVADHGGAIPASEAALRALPGIGPYTAAAVAAIAFEARAFALDGNTMRVLARLTGERRPIDVPATRAALHARGLAEVPRRRAGDFNQALMELGALVCTPRSPRCAHCPLAGGCRARAEGRRGVVAAQAAARRAPDRPRRVRLHHGRRARAGGQAARAGCSRGRGRCPRRSTGARARVRRWRAGWPRRPVCSVAGVSYRGAVRHVFTHRDVTAELFRVEVAASGPAAADRRWIAPGGLAALGVSSFARKTVALGVGR